MTAKSWLLNTSSLALPPSSPVEGQLWKRPKQDSFELMQYVRGDWVLFQPDQLDDKLPMHTFDLVRLVSNLGMNRTPLFAGRLKHGRTYMKDFVSYAFNMLAICDVDDFKLPLDLDCKVPNVLMRHIDRDPSWTVLTHNFKPIDAYNLNQDLMQIRVLTKTDGLRRGLNISSNHPNILTEIPESKKQVRIIFCADCEETYPTSYEVNSSVWRSVVSVNQCFLCLPCLQKRLGRKLCLDDFTNGDINTGLRFGYALAKSESNEE